MKSLLYTHQSKRFIVGTYALRRLYKNRSAEHIKKWANLGSFQIIKKVANKIVGIKNISQPLVINQYCKNITIIRKYEVVLLFMLLDFKVIPKYSKTNAFMQVKL